MPQGVFLTAHTFSLSLAIRHLVVSPMPFSLGERRVALHAQARCIGHAAETHYEYADEKLVRNCGQD